MSRIGKQTIPIPEKTTVTTDGSVVLVKGPHGELSRTFHDSLSVSVDGDSAQVVPKTSDSNTSALWGTYASHLRNMITGVNEPYTKKLIVEGVGYRAALSGKTLSMQLGFSHPVDIAVPEGLTVTVEKNEITVSGIDKELVGSFAADIRSNKKPEPYKGKGIRYDGEIVRRKQGKRAV